MYSHYIKRLFDLMAALCALPFFLIVYVILAPFYFLWIGDLCFIQARD